MQTQSRSQTESQQDMMQESVNTSMREVECARSQDIIKVGQMPGFECENRVYSSLGISPSIKIGGDPKKLIEIEKYE